MGPRHILDPGPYLHLNQINIKLKMGLRNARQQLCIVPWRSTSFK